MSINIFKIKKLDISYLLHREGYNDKFIEKNEMKYHFFIYLVLKKSLRKENKKEKVKIYTKQLESLFGKYTLKSKGIKDRHLVYLISDHLVQWGIIIKAKWNESLTKITVEYKIKDENIEQGIEPYKLTATNFSERNFINRVKSHFSDQQNFNESKYKGLDLYQSNKSVYDQLKINYHELELNNKDAYGWISEALANNQVVKQKRNNWNYQVEEVKMTPFNASYWCAAVSEFEHKWFTLSKDGRCYSNSTNLPSQLRPFIHYKGARFVELDIANSQPLLLALLAKKWYTTKSDDFGEDLNEYLHLCEEGKLYDHLMTEFQKSGLKIEKNTFKTDFFARVVFNDDMAKTKHLYRNAFAQLYPSIDIVIENLKKPGYKNASFQLRKYEAELIIHRIAGRLTSEIHNPFFTLHDGIFCLEKDQEIARKVIMEEYSKEGLAPCIKIK